MAELTTGFLCGLCGKHHEVLPLSFSVKAPLAVAGVAPEEIASRVVINPEQCVVDGERYFLRGRIVLPILDFDQPFIWGVWAEVSPKNFLRTHQLWRTAGRERSRPFPGWLDTNLPLYGTTLNLEVEVQTQPVGRRPHFLIRDAKHPLQQEQVHGISLARVEEIAAEALHGGA